MNHSNDPKNLPTYTSEEVASILSRALDRQRDGGRISHDELLETAREIGMTTLEVDAAVATEVKLRAERIAREEGRLLAERLALAEAQQRAARGFFLHAVVFAVVGMAITVIDLKKGEGALWYYIIPAWALVVVAQAAFTFRAAAASAAAQPEARLTPTTTRVAMRGNKMELR